MHISTTLALEATYRAFGNVYDYAGNEVLMMSDIEIVVEHQSQKAMKIRTTDVPRITVDGFEQLVNNTIGGMKIVSWEYHGNDREEIIFTLESDGRGN